MAGPGDSLLFINAGVEGGQEAVDAYLDRDYERAAGDLSRAIDNLTRARDLLTGEGGA